jgi:hypothetical protein
LFSGALNSTIQLKGVLKGLCGGMQKQRASAKHQQGHSPDSTVHHCEPAAAESFEKLWEMYAPQMVAAAMAG